MYRTLYLEIVLLEGNKVEEVFDESKGIIQ